MDALEATRIESALAAQSARENASDETGQADFLQMLVAQLQNQDPLNPQDSADFAAQLAQFSTVEQLIGVREGVDALVARANAGGPGAGGGPDPTQLIGREVVVFGSQIEVGASREPISLPFRTTAVAESLGVRVLDARGNPVHSESLVARDGSGQAIGRPPGDHRFDFDPAEHNLAPGVYAIEFDGVGVDGEAIGVLPMVSGRVTGAILAGDPSIRIGGRVFPVADVLEVRLPETTGEPAG